MVRPPPSLSVCTLTPVPASTQWDVLNAHADALQPVGEELVVRAALGSLLCADDTTMRILALMGKRRQELVARGELKDPDRTGLFTTAIVSITDDDRPVAVFLTGRKHAGENLDDVLDRRLAELGPPLLMTDALSRNRPKRHAVQQANCNAHARRGVVDEVHNFPSECQYVLEQFGKVFKNDELCKKWGLSAEQRLAFHQQQSGPVMADLEAWIKKQFDDKLIEPNSGMGKALKYITNHWDKLTAFLHIPGAPLDNNRAERAIKRAIVHRKNSLFYRSQRGAEVGDLFMMLIYTAELNEQNPHHYLTALLEHERAVAEDPADWLPWSYRDTLARLAGESDRLSPQQAGVPDATEPDDSGADRVDARRPRPTPAGTPPPITPASPPPTRRAPRSSPAVRRAASVRPEPAPVPPDG